MKPLVQFIKEKLIIKKNKTVSYKYFPETKEELQDIIKKRIGEEGNTVDLNDIDVSNITDMSHLFEGIDFNGDISNWDVSGVTGMSSMFVCSNFNQDISRWDVSNVTNMVWMFANSKFNQDISNWNVRKDCETLFAFYDSSIKEEYKPKMFQS